MNRRKRVEEDVGAEDRPTGQNLPWGADEQAPAPVSQEGKLESWRAGFRGMQGAKNWQMPTQGCSLIAEWQRDPPQERHHQC